jgi:hypothetical protein
MAGLSESEGTVRAGRIFVGDSSRETRCEETFRHEPRKSGKLPVDITRKSEELLRSQTNIFRLAE